VVIPIDGEIDLGLAPFVKRSIEQAQDARVIVLDINTFGGRVDAAVRIRDALLASGVPTVAFVNRRAISAGALISLAADYIVFTEGATMGAATPIEVKDGKADAVGEKVTSYMRSEMRSTAEAKDRDGEMAAAMVDADIEIPGLIPQGKLLTLTTEMALQTGIANGTSETLDELIGTMGLRGQAVVRTAPNWAEKTAGFLTSPVVAGLLMLIGFLALMGEVKTPGFGIPGAIGLVCLGLFFAGHMVVELAGWEEILLATFGLIALGVEVFVTPGFGWPGVLGVVLLVAALVLAMLDGPPAVLWATGAITSKLGMVMLVLFAAVGLFMLVLYVLGRMGRVPKQSSKGWLILSRTLATAKSSTAEDGPTDDERKAKLVGRVGVAETDLRPAGKARFESDVLDVVSDLHYIDRGTTVRIVDIEGVRVVVTRESEK
jgi:membrane-bound serine protease (ClpP class)